MREENQAGYRQDEPAEEFMEHMLESLSALKNKFNDDAEAMMIIQREINLTKDWIDENDYVRPEIAPRSLGTAAADEQAARSRSIFDDIDE